MKKLFTSLILLMAGVMAVHAEQHLYVGGKSINLSSSATYSGGGITSGSVYYDASSKTLTLNNAVISGTNCLSGRDFDQIYIKLDGDCKITPSTNDYVRFDNSNVQIQGNGNKFTIDFSANTNSNYCAFDIEGGYLQIWNTIIDFKAGAGSGFYGSSSSGKLQMIRVYGTIKGDAGAIERFKSVDITDDCQIFTEGATYSSGVGVVDASGSLATTLEVRPFLMVGQQMIRTYSATFSGGVAKWTKSSKTLELTAGLTTSGYPVVSNFGIDGLNIKCADGYTYKATNTSAFVLYKATTFSSCNSVKIEASNSGSTAIYPMTAEAALTFDGVTMMEVTGGYGIDGNGTQSEQTTLTFKYADMKVTGSNCAMGRIKAVDISSCCVNTTETPVFFNASAHGFTDISGTTATNVLIGVPSTTYNVKVLDNSITNLNATNVLVDGLTAGKISYDNSSKTLTLNNVTLTDPEGVKKPGIRAINHTVETITLTGSNTVTTKDYPFVLYGDCTIEGDGSLIATSTEETGISMTQYNNSCTLTLNVNNTVKFLGANRGIWGHNGYTSDLVLKKAGSNSDYYFKGTNYGAVYEVSDLKLTDMDFWSGSDGTPGCYFDGGYVRQNGGATVKGGNVVNFYQLSSASRYGIKVGGVEVTYCNRDGVGSKYITAGGGKAVTYSDNTLTLNGATINTEGGSDINCIRNESVDGLTINVASDSRIESRVDSWGGFYTKKNTTITGAGKLTVDYINNPNYCFSVSGGSLTLKDINMSIAGDLKGYTSGGDNYLYIDLAAGKRVEVAGSVYDFTDITFRNGSKLLEPEGAWYDNTNKYVTTGSGKATGIVFADKDATGIMGIEMDQNAEVESIFDAQGRQVDELQQGVNIIRMSDGTTRKVIKK